MNRTRSQRLAGIRAGLLVALYLFTLLPATALAADPSSQAAAAPPASPAAPAAPATQPSPPPVASQPPVASPQPSAERVPSVRPGSSPTTTPEPNRVEPPAEAPTANAEEPRPSDTPPPPSGVPISQPPAPAQPPRAPDVPGASGRSEDPIAAVPTRRYLVTFTRDSTTRERVAAVSSGEAAIISNVPALDLAIVDVPVGASLAASLAALWADPAVKSLEQDHTRDIEAMPADLHIADQWSLPTIGWDIVHLRGLPAGTVTVAILDTGVDVDHPDLQGRLLPGVSFVDGSAADTDPNGHGTWLTGIVAAATDNGAGIAGLGGPGVRVLPITVLGADGTGEDSAVISGIVEAVDRGAGVILMAFSNPGYSPALQAAVDYAWSHDVVLIAANGNDGTIAASYPAGDRGVMGIASTGRDDRLALDSNHGPQTFLAAPGVDILTTASGSDNDPATDDEYRSISGTSAAAAEVAGAVAVLRALDAEASNAVIVGRLARAGAGTHEAIGNGRLDLARAVADRGTSGIRPAGVAGGAEGGPFVGPYLAAASRTWTGLGLDNNWSNALNWGGVAPVAGDDLVFPSFALRLANTNDLTAGTSFNSITIQGTGYTLSGNAIALGIGGLAATDGGASNSVNLAMSMAATDTITVTDESTTLALGGIISGAGGLTKSGAGTLVLTAVNTYTGATTLSSGIILARSNTALGTTAGATTIATGAALGVDGSGLAIAEPVVLNGTGPTGTGAIRNLANNNTWSGAMTLASASSIASTAGTFSVSATIATAGFGLTVDGAGNTTKSTGAISGTGGVSLGSTGTLLLTFVNTYTGPTTISAGTLRLGIANAVGASSAVTVVSGATFDLAGFSDAIGSLAGAGTVTNSAVGAATLTAGGNATSTAFSGVLSAGTGTLALTKTGAGTLTLSGANTYTGVTTVTTGVLRLQSTAALGTTAGGTTVASAAAIEIDGSGLVMAEPITSIAGTGVAGGGALRNLANANTWSGTITLAATPRLNSDSGTLALPTGITGAGQVLTVGGAGNTTISGVIGTTSGGLTKDGVGTLFLSGVNSYTGATTISGGTLKVGVANAISSGSAVTVAAAATFDLAGFNEAIGSLAGAGSVTTSVAGAVTLTVGSNNTSTTFSGVASDGGGTLSIAKVGTLIQTLSGVNTYTGGTTINAGSVSIVADTGLGAVPASPTPGQLTFNGGTLVVTVSTTLNANRGIALTGAGSISTTVTVAYGGIIAGAGNLTKLGTGTLTLSGVNTYSGATFISAGTVGITTDSALGAVPGGPSAGQLTFSAGTLLVSANLTLSANRGIALTGAGTISTTFAVTYGGIIAGAGTLAKLGTGTLTLAGVNTYTGATFISAGTISVASDSALGTAPGSPTAGKLTFSAGTLLASASFTLDPNRGIALTGTATISTSAGVTLSYGGIIAGASTLTKTGTGTLTLAGTNTYTGATTLSAGTVRVQSSAALGTTAAGATVATGTAIEISGSGLLIPENLTSIIGTGIASGGALRNLDNDNTWSGNVTLGTLGATVVSDAGTFTLSGSVSGVAQPLTLRGAGNTTIGGTIGTMTGSLTKAGPGTLTLSGINTYTGVTTISVGTLKLGVANAISSGSALTVAAGATFDLAGFNDAIGSLAGAGSVTTSVAGAVTLTAGVNNTSTTFSGVASDGSGTLALTKVGTLILTLSGVNTYTGATTINAGTVSVANDANLGSAPATPTAGQVTLGDGTLLASASFTLNANRGIALTGTGTISITTALTLTYGGIVAGSGNLTKVGAGTVILSGVNTYSGITTLSAGVISIAADSGLGTAPGGPTAGQLIFNGGTLLATATFTLGPNRGIALTGAGTLSVNTGVTLTYGGIIAGAGALTKTSAGSLVLNGVNTYTGATNINGGIVAIAADSGLGTAPGAPTAAKLSFNTGTLLVSATFAVDANRGIAFAGTATISTDPGIVLTYGGVAAGAGAFTKLGAGTFVLSGLNTYTGATAVNAGTVRLGVANAIGAGSALTVAAGATFDLAGLNEAIGSLAGAGSVTTSVAGAVTLTAGSNNTSTTFSGVASDGGGTLSIVKVGTLIQTLSGVNTFRGPTTINGGSVSIAADTGLGTAPASATAGHLTFNGGTLVVTVNTTLNANRGIALTGAGTISPNTSRTLTYAGIIAGPGNLTKVGAGTVTLSGVNTYTGVTTMGGGVLSVAADAALGTAPGVPTAGNLVFSAGTLLASASFTLNPNRGIALTGAGTLSTGTGVTLQYAGIIAGASALTKTGTGTLVLSGVNTYTGATSISAGTVSIGADSGIGVAPGTPTAARLTFSTGTLRATASFTLDTNRGIALTGTGTILTDPGVALSYGGIIAGASALTKSGTGTLTLSGVNTFTGATTISAGTLSIAADSGLGAAPGSPTAGKLTFGGGTLLATASYTLATTRGVALTGAGTLSTDTGVTLAYGGVIAGASTLTKAGAGTLTLSGVNTYTGRTTIGGGVLSIAADTGLGTPPGAATPGKLTIDGGTLRTTASFTLNATRGIAPSLPGGATLSVASGTTLVYGGTMTGAGTLTKADAGSLSFSAGSISVGGVTIMDGTLVGPSGGLFGVTGTWTNNASTGAFVGGAGTVTFNGSTPQTVGGAFATTFGGLTIANINGISLNTDATVAGTLTLTNGTITTGSQAIYLASGGSVSRTNGHVVGNFKKSVPTGAPSVQFEVGDATVYAPVTLAFDSVSAAGDLTVSTTAGDHPAIGDSTFDPALSVNRFWTLTSDGIVFTTYDATFIFAAADVDPGVDALHVVTAGYSGGAWASQFTGMRTLSSTQAVGISTFGEFAIGEVAGSSYDHFVVSAPATATAGSPFDVTVTMVDAAGNTLTGYTGTISFTSTDPFAELAPTGYTFDPADNGTKTFGGLAVLNVAGDQRITVSDAVNSGTTDVITVSAGTYTQLQVLVPGETSAPGSLTGKIGSPDGQTANTAFSVVVKAVDAYWNPVASTDMVAITASDADAILPADAGLLAGAGSFVVVLETGGSATVTATNVTNGSITAGVSSAIQVTDNAPVASDDGYSVRQDNTLRITAPGVLVNDADADGQSAQVAPPRPLSGPFHGVLTLAADGSFVYTPTTGYVGTDTFTYVVIAGGLTSTTATVTIDVTSAAYLSSSGWSTSFDSDRFLSLTFPDYVPAGSVVTGATFRHSYRSATSGDATCYFFEVYAGPALLATHGSSSAPIACNASSSFVTEVTSLPEVDSVATATGLTIVLYLWNSGGHRSLHQLATVGVDYYED